jgi:hypothetical protein
MKKLKRVARASGVSVKSNNGGIGMENTMMSIRSVVKKWT